MAMTAAQRALVRLYHFTDTRNLESIRLHGLCSLAELEGRGIEIPAPGGNELSHDLDRVHGLDEYVHLCFLAQHPMEWRARQDGRILRTAWLRIDVAVLERDGVLFVPDVANKNDVPRHLILEAFEGDMIDVEALYTSRLNWSVPEQYARRVAAEKCETLIPRRVAPKLITFP